MQVAIAIKYRNTDTGEWKEFAAADLSGKKLGDFFTEAAGREIVAEVVYNGTRCFFCGTEHWRERMERKGKAVLFDRAISVLKEKNPQLLDEIIPGTEMFESAFPGTVVCSAEFYPEGKGKSPIENREAPHV